MTSGKVIGGGLLAGIVFYVLSMIVWALFKFLPVIPFSIALPSQGLMAGWQIEHLVVSLVAGILWAVGYTVYGKARPGGWLYGLVIFVAGILPAFIASFVVNGPVRSAIAYGALVSLIGALLGGKAISLVVRK